MHEEVRENGGPVEGGTATAQVSAGPPPPRPQMTPVAGPTLNVRSTTPEARGREVAFLVVAAFFANLALRTTIATTAASVAVVLLIAMFASAGRKLQRDAKILLGLAGALAPWLAIRSSESLTAVTFLSILGLLALAAGLSMKGSLFDSKVRDFARHQGALIYEWVYGLAMVKRTASGAAADARGASMIRGAAVALPILVVFGLLLAQADDVFAQFLLLGDLPAVFGHVATTAIVAVTFLAYLSRRAHETEAEANPKQLSFLGPIEINVILGSLVTLFAAFVGTQLLVAVGGADQILETEGLTQADHARRGFFQLVWVAGLSMGLVGVLRAIRRTPEENARLAAESSKAIPADRFTPLALLTLLLTLAIAGVSVQRLLLYIGTFGLSPLRLWALIGAGAIGVTVMVYALSIKGFRSGTDWFPGVAVLLGFVLIFGLNVVNPDAVVADFNLDRSVDTSSELDVRLLSRLSNDATTTIVNNLDKAGSERVALQGRICDSFDRTTRFGFLEYNRAEVSSDRALDELCGTRQTLRFSD